MKKISLKIVSIAILLLSVLAFGIKEAVAPAGSGIEPGDNRGSGGAG